MKPSKTTHCTKGPLNSAHQVSIEIQYYRVMEVGADERTWRCAVLARAFRHGASLICQSSFEIINPMSPVPKDGKFFSGADFQFANLGKIEDLARSRNILLE